MAIHRSALVGTSNGAEWRLTTVRTGSEAEEGGAKLSAVVLAGGMSLRMGTDKSFLRYHGIPFVTLISDKMMKISDDVVVVIGRKDERDYRGIVDGRVRIAKDAYNLRTPLAGLATGFGLAKHSYAVAVGCDTPLVNHDLLEYLSERARGRSAAVPIWRDIGRLEPLVSVYKGSEAIEAARDTIGRGKLGCTEMISSLRDVDYVDVSELKRFDPGLLTFLNINSKEDYDALLKRG